MKILPSRGELHIKLDKVSAGVLDTSSRKTAIEFGEVLAVGEGVTDYKKGDKIFFKSWALDIISHEDKDYFFINEKTLGIKGKVQ